MTTTRHEITIPKQTTEISPYKFIFEILQPFITSVKVRIPDGHKGMAHLRIFAPGLQLIPALASTEKYFTGDGDVIEEEVNAKLEGPPYKISCAGWNEDDFLSHTFYVSINSSEVQ